MKLAVLITSVVTLALLTTAACSGSSGVVYFDKAVPKGESALVSLNYVSAGGGTPVPFADGVPAGAFFFVGKRVVYAREAGSASGIYAVDLP